MKFPSTALKVTGSLTGHTATLQLILDTTIG